MFGTVSMLSGDYLHLIPTWKRTDLETAQTGLKATSNGDGRSHLLSFALLLADALRQAVLLHLKHKTRGDYATGDRGPRTGSRLCGDALAFKRVLRFMRC